MTERGKFAARRPIRTRLEGEDAVVAELNRRMPARGYAKRVAHDLGVSLNTVHAVASGKRAPSLRIAEGLGFRLIKDDDHPPG